MQVSSICSPLRSFTRTRHHYSLPLQFSHHHHHYSSSNVNRVSFSGVLESHAHGHLKVLPVCFSFRSLPSSALSNITSANTSTRRGRRRFSVVSAGAGGLERFTERAIKAVIYSQREAKALGKDMVFPQHLLLGLIAEDEEHHYHSLHEGFLGSGISLHKARDTVLTIWRHHHHVNVPTNTTSSSNSAAVPFSISTKRVFEAALHYSRTMSHHFIAPEHISIALFTLDEGSAARVLMRYVRTPFLFCREQARSQRPITYVVRYFVFSGKPLLMSNTPGDEE
jgi:ATP-dependent Clp protease ATP-binding subunit ClpC